MSIGVDSTGNKVAVIVGVGVGLGMALTKRFATFLDWHLRGRRTREQSLLKGEKS